MEIQETEIPTKTRNLLARSGITSLESLAQLSADKISCLIGIKSRMEAGRACLRNGITPQWLRQIAKDYSYDLTEPSGNEFALLSRNYSPHEYWMLERAICQLGPIQHAVSKASNGTLILWRNRRGYVDVEDEETESIAA